MQYTRFKDYEINITPEEIEECINFANDPKLEQSMKEWGESTDLTPEQQKQNTIVGKIGEVAVNKLLIELGAEKVSGVNYEIMKGGDMQDITVNDWNIAVKSTKFGKKLIIDWNKLAFRREKKEIPHLYILVRVPWDGERLIDTYRHTRNKAYVLGYIDAKQMCMYVEGIEAGREMTCNNRVIQLKTANLIADKNELKHSEEKWKNLVKMMNTASSAMINTNTFIDPKKEKVIIKFKEQEMDTCLAYVEVKETQEIIPKLKINEELDIVNKGVGDYEAYIYDRYIGTLSGDQTVFIVENLVSDRYVRVIYKGYEDVEDMKNGGVIHVPRVKLISYSKASGLIQYPIQFKPSEEYEIYLEVMEEFASNNK